MSPKFGRGLGALVAGLLFGAGLVVSGMTQPAKVIGFLDPFGHWDPSLLFVMVGAIAVNALAYRLVRDWAAPLMARRFAVPAGTPIDAQLVLGAAIFGVGWGLSGYCPGPAIVSVPSGAGGVWVFGLMLLAGTFIASRFRGLLSYAPESPLDHGQRSVDPSPRTAVRDS